MRKMILLAGAVTAGYYVLRTFGNRGIGLTEGGGGVKNGFINRLRNLFGGEPGSFAHGGFVDDEEVLGHRGKEVRQRII
jgi:hypothetical protein